MSCHHSNLHPVTNHDHLHFLHTELLLEIFRMSGISESLVCHRPLVDRSSDKNVNMAVLDILNRPLERYHGRFS